MTVSDAGRSRCADTFQFSAALTRNRGSTANVLSAVEPVATNPSASVSGRSGLVATLDVVESGGCCASRSAID